MRSYSLAGFISVICAMAGVLPQIAAAATVTQLDANDPMTWLVKSVCVDSQNQAVAADPYGGCPAGAGIRKLRSGDPLPYHNVEQIGYQQRDAFPLSNPLDGKTWVINTYDYRPFNYYNLYATTNVESDGYDVIAVQDGWASIANTSDGGGYGQAFFGSNCKLGDGWVLFPSTRFSSGGKATVPIADVYWEQTDHSYPGGCPSKYSTTSQTSWKTQKSFQFGGVNGNPKKTMDTLVSYHGFQSSFNFLFSGHIEVFYFTREYGMTRWEVWTPTLQSPTKTSECIVPNTQSYNGVTFVVSACHDWSKVNNPLPTSAEVPIWPVPNVNLLQNPHFISTSVPWISTASISAAPQVSTAWRDSLFAKPGVGYLQLSCGTECTQDYSIALYQDLPASQFVVSGTYGFGITARTQPDATQCPAPCQGTIGVGVEQLDAGGKILSAESVNQPIKSDNGTPDPTKGEADSVYLSTAFVSGAITIDPKAATIRFLISPQTAQTFDVLNAWLAAWPNP